MKVIYVLMFVSLFFLPQCVAEPNKEKNIIDKLFPDHHLISLKDLDLETSTFFSQEFPNDRPGIVSEDFNGDGIMDYATLLRQNNSTSTKLVIFLCEDGAKCKIVYQLNVSNYHDIAYLTLIKQGASISQTEAIDSENKLSTEKLKHPGVKLTYFEKAEIVLYWDSKNQEIKTLQISD